MQWDRLQLYHPILKTFLFETLKSIDKYGNGLSRQKLLNLVRDFLKTHLIRRFLMKTGG